MKDYKKTAIKLFEKHDFAASMKYFSLAYENEKDAEILLMIDLCGCNFNNSYDVRQKFKR